MGDDGGAGLSLTGALASVQRRKAAGLRVSPVDAEKCRRAQSPCGIGGVHVARGSMHSHWQATATAPTCQVLDSTGMC